LTLAKVLGIIHALCLLKYRGIAQPGSAPALGAGRRGFKSLCPDQKKHKYNLLPEKISDEGAYYLVNFFMNLALELESCYFAQMKRYIDDNMPPNIIQNTVNGNHFKKT
jgi:hypothetical protein